MILGLILHGQSKKTHKVCSGAPAKEELSMLSDGETAGLGIARAQHCCRM